MCKVAGQLAVKTIVNSTQHGLGIVVGHEIYQPLLHKVQFTNKNYGPQLCGLDTLEVLNTQYVQIHSINVFFRDLLDDYIEQVVAKQQVLSNQHTSEHVDMTVKLQEKYKKLRIKNATDTKPSEKLQGVKKDFIFQYPKYSENYATITVEQARGDKPRIFWNKAELSTGDIIALRTVLSASVLGMKIGAYTMMIGDIVGRTSTIEEVLAYFDSLHK